MLSALAALVLLGSTADRDIEGLLIDTPVELKPLAGEQTFLRAFAGQVTSTSIGGAMGITQVITVAVTDLDKLPTRPSAEQLLRMHERGSRTRQGFAGQLMKTEDTTLDGNPMTVIVGSASAPGAGNTYVNAYHVSAATTVGDKQYEVTWLCFNAGEEFSNAMKAVRNLRIKKGAETIAPKKLIGTSGDYTLLGVPYAWKLPAPATVSPSALVKDSYAGRYQSSLTMNGYVAQIEIIQFKEAPKNMTPAAMARETTYDWIPETGGPEPVLEGGVYRYDNLTVPIKRKARVEVALKDKLLVVLTVACPESGKLPSRDEISLKALP